MAEALAVVGVVASIVQLVEFGFRRRLDDFQSSLGEIPRAFRHVRDELPILLDTLERTTVAVEKESIREETKRALLPTINGCREQIELLDGLLERMLPRDSDSWRKRTGKAISSLRQESKVAKITTIFKSYIQTLTYYHAASSTL